MQISNGEYMNKKWFSLSLTALLLGTMIVACDDSSSSSSDDDPEISSSSVYKNDLALGFVVGGSTIFIGTGSMEHISDIGSDFIEAPSEKAGMYYFDGSLYFYDMLSSIDRYELDENNKMSAAPIASAELGFGSNHVYFVDKTKAYVGGMTDTLFVINPKTMKITKKIALNKYKDSKAIGVWPESGVIADGRLYVSLAQSTSTYTAGDTAKVLILDIEKDSILSIAKDTRVSAVGSLDDGLHRFSFEADDGYIYFYGLASWGYAAGQKDGFLRIKKGELDFDEDYVFNISDEIAIGGELKDNKGDYKYLMSTGFEYFGGTIAYGYITLSSKTSNSEDYMQYICQPVKIDFKAHTMESLPLNLSTSWNTGLAIESDTSLIFGLSTAEDGNAYIRYNPKTNKTTTLGTLKQGGPMWIQKLD